MTPREFYGLSYFHKTGYFFVDGTPGSLIERAQERAKINPTRF